MISENGYCAGNGKRMEIRKEGNTMNKELVELRAVFLKEANVCRERAKQFESEYYSAKADAFCSAIIELDKILIKCMKGER